MTKEEVEGWMTARWADAHDGANDTINELARIAFEAINAAEDLAIRLRHAQGVLSEYRLRDNPLAQPFKPQPF